MIDSKDLRYQLGIRGDLDLVLDGSGIKPFVTYGKKETKGIFL